MALALEACVRCDCDCDWDCACDCEPPSSSSGSASDSSILRFDEVRSMRGMVAVEKCFRGMIGRISWNDACFACLIRLRMVEGGKRTNPSLESMTNLFPERMP